MPRTKKNLNSGPTQDLLSSSSTLTPRLLSTEEVARILIVPVSTLYTWRYKGIGPKAFRVGKHLRYRIADILDWLERDST